MLKPKPESRSLRTRSVAILVFVAVMSIVMAACSTDETSEPAPSGDAVTTTTETAATDSTVPSELGEMSAEDQAAVDAAITAGIDRVTLVAPAAAPIGFWVGVWDPEKGTYLTAQGDAAEGQPATVDDHYRIGSVTKTFTATVILQLVDEGSLALDTTIDAVLPDLAATHPEIAAVTVESLLNMTSRIDDYLNVPDSVVAAIVADPSRVWEPEELIDAALEPGLLPEGTASYSTTNMIILQLMSESIEDRPLADSIEERLTGPLGMNHTTLPIEDPSLPDPSADGHINAFCVDELTRDGAVGVDTTTDPTDWTISYAQGGGGITSTLADLGTWAQSLSGNEYLSAELQQVRLATTSLFEPDNPPPYVYGLGIYQLGDGWYGHDGEAIGWQAIELHNPDTGVSIAMASNSCAAQSILFFSILNELYPDQTVDDWLTAQLGG